MPNMLAIIGRFLIGLVFACAGAAKLLALGVAKAELARVGLPGELAMAVGLFELVVGLCLAFGVGTLLAAPLLIATVALDTLYYHNAIADPAESGEALKNIAIIGGLLVVMGAAWLRRVEQQLRVDLADEIVDHRYDDQLRRDPYPAGRRTVRQWRDRTGL